MARLSAELPPDEGALVAARDELFRSGEGDPVPHTTPDRAPNANDVSWADAFMAMAERSLGAGATSRPHHDRHLVLLHVGTGAEGATGAHLHLGPALSDGLRRFVGCDARIRPIIESGGRPVSVGRAFRTVPERTRMVIEERDRGCRVPGCDAIGGSMSTISSTGRTEGPRIHRICWPCAAGIIASTTSAI